MRDATNEDTQILISSSVMNMYYPRRCPFGCGRLIGWDDISYHKKRCPYGSELYTILGWDDPEWYDGSEQMWCNGSEWYALPVWDGPEVFPDNFRSDVVLDNEGFVGEKKPYLRVAATFTSPFQLEALLSLREVNRALLANSSAIFSNTLGSRPLLFFEIDKPTAGILSGGSNDYYVSHSKTRVSVSVTVLNGEPPSKEEIARRLAEFLPGKERDIRALVPRLLLCDPEYSPEYSEDTFSDPDHPLERGEPIAPQDAQPSSFPLPEEIAQRLLSKGLWNEEWEWENEEFDGDWDGNENWYTIRYYDHVAMTYDLSNSCPLELLDKNGDLPISEEHDARSLIRNWRSHQNQGLLNNFLSIIKPGQHSSHNSGQPHFSNTRGSDHARRCFKFIVCSLFDGHRHPDGWMQSTEPVECVRVRTHECFGGEEGNHPLQCGYREVISLYIKRPSDQVWFQFEYQHEVYGCSEN